LRVWRSAIRKLHADKPRAQPHPLRLPALRGRSRVAADRRRPGELRLSRCGEFSISGTDAALIERGELAYADMRFVERDGTRFLTGPRPPPTTSPSASLPSTCGWGGREVRPLLSLSRLLLELIAGWQPPPDRNRPQRHTTAREAINVTQWRHRPACVCS
jgi:hypothetical protein